MTAEIRTPPVKIDRPLGRADVQAPTGDTEAVVAAAEPPPPPPEDTAQSSFFLRDTQGKEIGRFHSLIGGRRFV